MRQCPRSSPSASLPKHKTRFEARFGRAEVLGTADEAFEVIGLPEGIQSTEARLVDETARNAFPALERVGERFAVAEGEERMDVIGHDEFAPEVVALAVEVMEAVGDDLGEAWITQVAGTVGGVEVFVELVGELAVVAGFGDVVPRRRIRGEEGVAVATQSSRNSRGSDSARRKVTARLGAILQSSRAPAFRPPQNSEVRRTASRILVK